MKMKMTTFAYYRYIRHEAVRILVNCGVPVRTAFKMVRANGAYLFNGYSQCKAYDANLAMYPIEGHN